MAAASMKRAGNGYGVIFKRLPHHFKHVARKLRQLVEKQQTVVRQRDFAGPWDDAAADQARVGDGVMRRTKRTLRHQAGRSIQHAGDGVNLSCLQCLFKCERSQDGRQPLGQHGLAGAGRADHKNIVAAGRGHFKRALGRLLPAHVFEVHGKVLQLTQQRLGRYSIRLALNGTHHRGVEQLQHVKQRRDRVHIHTFHNRCLGGIGRGQNQIRNILLARQDGDGQHARHSTHAAVEAQFAHHKEAAHIVHAQRAVSAEDADGNGQVETRALLFHVGRRQVDGDEGGRNQIAGVLDGRAHAVAALAHRGVRQADGVEDILLHHCPAIVHLDIDEVGIDAVDSRAESFEEHD